MPNIYKCPNSNEGCNYTVNRKSLAATHEKQCKEKRRNSFQCAHQQEGCDYKIQDSDLLDHEQQCEYRKVKCPDGLCQQMVKVFELENHIKTAHPDADWEHEAGTTAKRNWFISKKNHMGSKANNWVLNLWTHDDKIFIARFRKLGGLWFSWVYIIGSIKDATDYTCRISTANGDSIGSSLAYEGPIHCIDETEEDICKSAECLVMTDATVEFYLEPVDKVEHFSEGYDGRLPLDYVLKADFQNY